MRDVHAGVVLLVVAAMVLPATAVAEDTFRTIRDEDVVFVGAPAPGDLSLHAQVTDQEVATEKRYPMSIAFADNRIEGSVSYLTFPNSGPQEGNVCTNALSVVLVQTDGSYRRTLSSGCDDGFLNIDLNDVPTGEHDLRVVAEHGVTTNYQLTVTYGQTAG